MKLSRAINAALSLLFFTSGFAQQPQPVAPGNEKQQKQNTTPKKRDEVVRISVTLVQVDVTVTDRKGRAITDLKPEDFELFQNKKPQLINRQKIVRTETVRL